MVSVRHRKKELNRRINERQKNKFKKKKNRKYQINNKLFPFDRGERRKRHTRDAR